MREVFTPEQIPGILTAYMEGLKLAFALAIALAGVTLPIAGFAVYKEAKPRVGGLGVEGEEEEEGERKDEEA